MPPPVLTAQPPLGHKNVDTTLKNPRVFDGTVATDYCRAMAEVDSRFQDSDNGARAPVSGQPLALVAACTPGRSTMPNVRPCRYCVRGSWLWPKRAATPGHRCFDEGSSACHTARTQGKAGEGSRFPGCSLPFSFDSLFLLASGRLVTTPSLHERQNQAQVQLVSYTTVPECWQGKKI
jgi:hypothetical protein